MSINSHLWRTTIALDSRANGKDKVIFQLRGVVHCQRSQTCGWTGVRVIFVELDAGNFRKFTSVELSSKCNGLVSKPNCPRCGREVKFTRVKNGIN